jgi:hypothetical protein
LGLEKQRIKDRLNNNANRNLFDGLALLLRGNPVVVFGDELGFSISDKYMQWDATANCGFSINEVAGLTKCDKSVKKAMAHGAGETLANMYESLLKLKREPSLNWGELEFAKTNDMIAYVRVAKRFNGYIIAANTRNNAEVFDLRHEFDFSDESRFAKGFALPFHSTVEYFYAADKSGNNDFAIGAKVANNGILLKPGEFLVLKFENE